MVLRIKAIHSWLLILLVSLVLLLSPRVSGEVLAVSTSTDTSVSSQVIVQGGWGSNSGQFGKVDQASRPGPTDFALVNDTLHVLDPVNARVQLFDLDGDFRSEIPIETKTADFICVDHTGRVTVLDAFVKREFKTFSPCGELLVRARVPDSIGLCSAIWADGDRIWIEERHNRVHEIAARTDRREIQTSIVETLPGRPIGKQRRPLHAWKTGAEDVRIQDKNIKTLRFDRPVASIVALESDDYGRVYLAAICRRMNTGDPWKTEIVLAVVGPDGHGIESIRMPNAYVTDHYRKLGVSRSGEIIQMQTTEDGVSFIRWSLGASSKKGATR